MTRPKPILASIPPRPLSQGEIRGFVEAGICPFCGRGTYRIVAIHTEMIHGVDRWELRELLGVTWTTSISPDVTEQRSAQMRQLHRDGRIPSGGERGSARGPHQFSTAGIEKQKATLRQVHARHAQERSERHARGKDKVRCSECRKKFVPPQRLGKSTRRTCSERCYRAALSRAGRTRRSKR